MSRYVQVDFEKYIGIIGLKSMAINVKAIESKLRFPFCWYSINAK